MLLVQNLSFFRKEKQIFEDKHLSLSEGKIILLSGKNGSGKTTFLKTILNILEPSKGSIYWKGKLLKKNLYDYYKNITFIPDRPSSIKQLSVLENIQIWKKFFLSKIDSTQIKNIIEIMNLDDLLTNKVNSLSMGEIKKLELIRLIIENKKIWYLDEPLSNLDSETIEIVKQTFLDHTNNGGCIVFSSHNLTSIRISEEINF